ncbi:Clavaminate synthase-like protein [Thozetella sp. PMI_491]|nr:Clavaminate synthase-like protein [Thozetella sp. PMI_491]
MTETILAEVDSFVPVRPTGEDLDYADLEILDFSLYNDGPDARQLLASQVRKAMSTQGFFVIVNHGIAEGDITRMVDIGHTILTRTPPEEKEKLKADIIGKGEYPGFKPRGHWKSAGVDRIENFNINRDMSLHEQPSALKPYRSEIQTFVDSVHKDVLYKLLRLFALALELESEDFFVKLHSYEKHDESWFRWMEYYDDNSISDEAGKTPWLGGHQDLSGLSLLFSQPMATLQVRDYEDDAQWKYIRHIPGAIIVNAGEPMMWWTGDYFKAAVHRVIQPPEDQRGHDRSSVFYFVVPNDDVVINTLLDESPVLQRAGVKKWFEDGKAPTSKEWVNNRIRVTGQKTLFTEGEKQNSVQQKIGNVTTTWFR